MKILIVAPTHKLFISKFLSNYDEKELPDGYFGAPFFGDLIYEYLERGHEVIALTTSTSTDELYLTKEYRNNKFTWIVVASRINAFKMNGFRLGRILDFFKLERLEMTKYIILNNPDIVHSHWSYEFTQAAKTSKLPYLVTIHDNPYVILKYFKNFYRFLRLLQSEMALKNVQYSSTVSTYMLDYAKKRTQTCKVIPNPIRVKYSQNEIFDKIDTRLKSIDEPIILMILNGWNSLKNGVAGLVAFKRFQQNYPNAQLLLIGKETEEYGPAFYESIKLELKNVNYLGPIDRDILMNKMNDAHLLIHPALEESFGVVLIEAMSMGIPVIGGKESGAVPWVINDDELLANVQSPESITELMTNCISSKEVYKSKGFTCYQNVKSRFSVEEIANAYLEYYERIIRESK